MKKQTDRVIALDYFRGVCIIAILLSHAFIIIGPFAYLSGMGRLWTSAAEMFFLISGITLGVVRGKLVKTNFQELIKKSWLRALDIYLIYIATVLAAVLLASILAPDGLNAAQGFPAVNGLSFLGYTLTFQFSSGLAIFLKFYAIYMLLAPFVLYALYKWKRFWFLPLALSALIYAAHAPYPHSLISLGEFTGFATWQLYFVVGLTLARFRLTILGWYRRLSAKTSTALRGAIIGTAGLGVAVSALVGFNATPYISRGVASGWLPLKLQQAYDSLYIHKAGIDLWLMNGRLGMLRPLAAVLFLSAAYVLYQKYKEPVLRYSGKFVITMGANTLWIFVGQALAIPLLAALPLPKSFATNVLLTTVLFGAMWAIAKRRSLVLAARRQARKMARAMPHPKYGYGYDYDIE